jgi:trk system potassium uptake protein TrkH
LIRPAVVINNLGFLLLIIGLAMLTCIPWSIIYREPVTGSLLLAAVITIGSGLMLKIFFATSEKINIKESFALVGLGWILASTAGSLPFWFSDYLSFADAFFETASGFSTTGATVIQDVEVWPKGLMFWRCLTQWLGGMGIIVLFIAIIAGTGARGNQLFQSELPGGSFQDKISPRVRETAQKLWKTYIVLSGVCLLLLLIFGMDLFDALCHTFTTLATGGFSTKNASIAYYNSPFIHWTIIIFMFLGGTNFSLHYLAFKKRNPPKVYGESPEFKLYAAIILLASIMVIIGLSHPSLHLSWDDKVRTAIFHVVSIITTTGFTVDNYHYWPSGAAGVIFLLMFSGGCIGSTSGNIKVGRYLIMMVRSINELKKMIHPKAVLPLRFGGRILNEDRVSNIAQFFFLYIMLIVIGVVILTILGIDLFSSLTAAVACLGNVGPGFGMVGPNGNYSFMPDVAKYMLSILMLIGRLEIFPLLLLLLPEYWKQ